MCDGAFRSDIQKASIVIIIKDAHGKIYDGRAEKIHYRAFATAEAFAILEVVKLAAQEENAILIISNCKCVVDAIGKPLEECPIGFEASMAAIQGLLNESDWCNVAFQSRSVVKEADFKAKKACNNTLLPDWIASFF
ncbi:unnamed protein product [Linum trigynum]|uniref:RNase H type-1 domain-containing protein n=1 Tax=Linum trigynum TaxID=586398 RepID=A0AAV2GI13_9ROSI